jgi:hypothetical protein
MNQGHSFGRDLEVRQQTRTLALDLRGLHEVLVEIEHVAADARPREQPPIHRLDRRDGREDLVQFVLFVAHASLSSIGGVDPRPLGPVVA